MGRTMQDHKSKTTPQGMQDPLTTKWEVAGELNGDGENFFVISNIPQNDRAWIILKNIPRRLADHIVSLHNADYGHD